MLNLFPAKFIEPIESRESLERQVGVDVSNVIDDDVPKLIILGLHGLQVLLCARYSLEANH